MIDTPSRRVLLGGTAGLTLSGMMPAAAAAAGGETAAPRASAAVSAIDFGVIGDAVRRPLSSRFDSLVAARTRYPAAANLDQSLDGVAIQAALDAAEAAGATLQIGGVVHLPAGRYILSEPLRLPNGVLLRGDGPNVTILDNQNAPLEAPMVVNKNRDTAFLAMSDLSIHGGTHGLHIEVSGSVDRAHLRNVSMLLQTDKNLECNKLLQQAQFERCTFGLSPWGIVIQGFTTNAASFFGCSFEEHSRSHLVLRSAECVNIYGGRFEAGGNATGSATIDLERAAAVNFHGVYFENVHELLLRDRQSRNGVTFTGCHFTGTQREGSFVPFRFESDGVVNFGPNDWNLRTDGPARKTVWGTNSNLAGTSRATRSALPGRGPSTSPA